MKTQVVIDQKNGQILATAFGKGREHDFKLFKKSKIRLASTIILLGDLGYQGIQKILPNAVIPIKASKKYPLTRDEKKENALLSSVRVKVENALSFIKRFKIFSTRYRNRRKRFGLRFNLFAAICNFEINLI